MATITLDFLRGYSVGEKRTAQPNTYQWDEGHSIEINVPAEVTTAELHYEQSGTTEAQAYEPTSITEQADGSYTILANVPNSYFEVGVDLKVYVVVTDNSASITTYEGLIRIIQRAVPSDYVDDDPDNSATSIIAVATESAEAAEAWAVGKIDGVDVPSTADQYHNNSKYYAEQAATVAASIPADYSTLSAQVDTNTQDISDVKNDLAEISSGVYPNMVSGGLIGDSYTVDKVPYLLRPSHSGKAQTGSVVGGTVVWNQLMPLDTDSWASNGLNITVDNGKMTINGTSSVSNTFSIFPARIYNQLKLITNHVYLLFFDGDYDFTSMVFSVYGSATDTYSMNSKTSKIFKPTVTNITDSEYIVTTTNGTSYSTEFTTYLCDLTQMFGSTIADYIYTLESGTAGAGVSKLRSWGYFTDNYYAYNTGELKHVSGVSAHIIRDADNNILGNYALDSDLVLRGISKLDASNELYYDGDTYEPDGTVTRKYGIRAYTAGDATDGSTMITDGTNTVYALSTPTTETADAYEEYQIVEADGTEQFVSTGIVPVGHDTKYFTDIGAKAETIPDAPTTDGTYTLTCTVSSGVPTYTWA